VIIIIIYKKYILYSVYLYFPTLRNVVYNQNPLSLPSLISPRLHYPMTLHYKPRNLAIFKAGETRAVYVACVTKFYYNKTLEKLSMRAGCGFKDCFI